MPGLEELLSFSYWTAERSEVVRNFSLALTGFIALFFLIWRAISADRAAKASMRQAEAALKQIVFLTRQQELVASQTKSLAKQAENVSRQVDVAVNQVEIALEEKIRNIMAKSIEQLSDDKNTMARVAGIYTIGKIGTERIKYQNEIANVIIQFVTTSRSRISSKPETSIVFNEEDGLLQKAEAMLSAGYVWRSNYPIETHWRFRKLVQEHKSKGFTELNEQAQGVIRNLAMMFDSLPPWVQARSVRKIPPADIQACIDVMSDIRKFDTGRIFDLSYLDLSYFNFTMKSFRGCHFFSTKMWAIDGIGVDFGGIRGQTADLAFSMLKNARFEKSDLKMAFFCGANLENANFTGADISGADFRLCSNLTEAQVRSAAKWDGVLLPKDLQPMFQDVESQWAGEER